MAVTTDNGDMRCGSSLHTPDALLPVRRVGCPDLCRIPCGGTARCEENVYSLSQQLAEHRFPIADQERHKVEHRISRMGRRGDTGLNPDPPRGLPG